MFESFESFLESANLDAAQFNLTPQQMSQIVFGVICWVSLYTVYKIGKGIGKKTHSIYAGHKARKAVRIAEAAKISPTTQILLNLLSPYTLDQWQFNPEESHKAHRKIKLDDHPNSIQVIHITGGAHHNAAIKLGEIDELGHLPVSEQNVVRDAIHTAILGLQQQAHNQRLSRIGAAIGSNPAIQIPESSMTHEDMLAWLRGKQLGSGNFTYTTTKTTTESVPPPATHDTKAEAQKTWQIHGDVPASANFGDYSLVGVNSQTGDIYVFSDTYLTLGEAKVNVTQKNRLSPHLKWLAVRAGALRTQQATVIEVIKNSKIDTWPSDYCLG